MKIAEQTSSRLVITENPRILAAILIIPAAFIGYQLIIQGPNLEWFPWALLALFVILLPLAMVFTVHWVKVTFIRSAGRIEITRRGLAYYKEQVFPMRWFKHARVDEQSDSDGTTARVVLVFDEAMLKELPPDQRPKPLTEREQNWLAKATKATTTLPPQEIPLTYYFSGGNEHDGIAKAINAWAEEI